MKLSAITNLVGNTSDNLANLILKLPPPGDYDYRVAIIWTIFVITAVAALVTTLATVSFLAIKAAVANPVDSLRDE